MRWWFCGFCLSDVARPSAFEANRGRVRAAYKVLPEEEGQGLSG